MEKEQHDSMATVQMTKADYAASEVYSTTSEPPPVSLFSYVHILHHWHFQVYLFRVWVLFLKYKNRQRSICLYFVQTHCERNKKRWFFFYNE